MFLYAGFFLLFFFFCRIFIFSLNSLLVTLDA
jgi:hypothetical protein